MDELSMPPGNALKNSCSLLEKIAIFMSESAKNSEGQMISFGIFGIIAYPIFYFINLYFLTPQDYSNLFLRIIAGLLCLGLALKNHWPLSLRKYLPFYWYFTLLFGLPFFFTFMLLKNHMSTAWIINSLIVLFIFILLVDWISFIVLLILGVSLGVTLYSLITPHPFDYNIQLEPVSFMDLLTTYIVSVIMGIIFSRNKERIEQEKLDAMKLLSANIVHELRTPLASISASAEGIKEYLPELIETYKIAKNENISIPQIRPSQFQLLSAALGNINAEANFANTIMNIMLINVDQIKLNAIDVKNCSIEECVNEALTRYPFSSGENLLVHWNKANVFEFLGNKLFVIHIVFNLLKNALYYIKVAQKGEIEIWFEKCGKYNKMYFKDTGKGISSDIMPYIFDRFFSKTYHGSGVGLAFCKMVMEAYGGSIACKSAENEYTQFILQFPALAGKT